MALDKVVITKLGKRYGTERALAEVTLELRAGTMCALLGHNGAGKTTLLGILSTLVRASHGRVAYFAGQAEVSGIEVRREIGMLAHASLCYGELSAIENLELVAGLYGLPGDAGASDDRGMPPGGSAAEGRRGMIKRELDRVGLDEKARGRASRTYSRGMVQRLALARALMTKPSLVLLDEPFTGLDREGALALGADLGALRDAGAIVVVVTHDLEAIAGRADHVAVLRRGKLALDERGGTYDYEQLKDIYHRQAN